MIFPLVAGCGPPQNIPECGGDCFAECCGCCCAGQGCQPTIGFSIPCTFECAGGCTYDEEGNCIGPILRGPTCCCCGTVCSSYTVEFEGNFFRPQFCGCGAEGDCLVGGCNFPTSYTLNKPAKECCKNPNPVCGSSGCKTCYYYDRMNNTVCGSLPIGTCVPKMMVSLYCDPVKGGWTFDISSSYSHCACEMCPYDLVDYTFININIPASATRDCKQPITYYVPPFSGLCVEVVFLFGNIIANCCAYSGGNVTITCNG